MKIKIRPLEEKDAYTSVKWRNMPEIWTYTAFKADEEVTLHDELNWVRRVTADLSGRRFAIIVDGVYVGNIYLTNIERGKGEYHIFIGEKGYWGRGVGKEATRQIIDYAREVLKLTRIELGVKGENLAALKLYRSLGFKPYSKEGDFVRMAINLGGL